MNTRRDSLNNFLVTVSYTYTAVLGSVEVEFKYEKGMLMNQFQSKPVHLKI